METPSLPIAVRSGILRLADASPRALFAVSSGERKIAATPLTDTGRTQRHAERSVVARPTLFTVDAGRVVHTVQTDATTFVLAGDVDAGVVAGNFRVVPTLTRVSVALTSCVYTNDIN